MLTARPDIASDIVDAALAEAGGATVPTLSHVPAAEIWESIRLGRTRLLACSLTATGCWLEIERRRAPIAVRHIATLERILRGEAQKVVAYDLGVERSSIALRVKYALRHIGLSGTARNLPIALIVLTQVAWGHLHTSPGLVAVVQEGTRRAVRLPRPDPRRCPAFSPTEVAIIDMLIEGAGRPEISRLRGRSLRTLANQMRRIYAKLEVSGRTSFLIRLVQLTAGAHK